LSPSSNRKPLTRPLTEKDDGSPTRSWFALSITVRTGAVPNVETSAVLIALNWL
jgi:hypothetical protein